MKEGEVDRDKTVVEALASAWASIDGKLDKFKREKDLDLDDPENTGSYEGYIEEAEELIVRLARRGYGIYTLR